MSVTTSDNYFETLNVALKNHSRAIPRMLIDLDRLDRNIETLKSYNFSADLRIVVKSLPSMDLLHYVMRSIGTSKLMVFHQPFLSDLVRVCTKDIDILLGKPMPIKTVEYFFNHFDRPLAEFNPFTQIQWLVDTPERLEEYLHLAKTLKRNLRVNLEIDVGLHRGGFADLASLKNALQMVSDHQQWISFSGFMGYDPHIVKLPKLIRSQSKALRLSNDFYTQCKSVVKKNFPMLWSEALTFNGSGSPTFELHTSRTSPLNDIAIGSALVKPTTFDIPTLDKFVPGSFIATPVLKKFDGTTIPGLEKIKSLFKMFDSKNQKSYFIYGGFWKADYCYPRGIRQNELFGASTNQTMLNSKSGLNLDVDDFVFLRPHQSEFVFLQFGDLLTIRNGKIEGQWKLLKNE